METKKRQTDTPPVAVEVRPGGGLLHVEEYIPLHYKGTRRRVTLNTGPETLVEQCHREETDINKIMAKYRVTGQLPPGRSEPRYADVSAIGDMMDVKLRIEDAMEAFDSLPESIRERWDNPEELLEAMDSEQFKQAQAEWLRQKTEEAEKQSDQVASNEATKPETTND